jgi:hypothetical protein
MNKLMFVDNGWKNVLKKKRQVYRFWRKFMNGGVGRMSGYMSFLSKALIKYENLNKYSEILDLFITHTIIHLKI